MGTEFAVSGDGTRIAFERSGTGPVLVLVDGAAMHRAFGTSRGLARRLAGFTAVTYDRRGRGESGDAPEWAPAREVEDLAAVVAATAADDAAVHTLSSGAVIALHAVAAGVPIRSLSMFEPPIDLAARPGTDAAAVEEVGRLLRAGRRRDAVHAFQAGIGMPAAMIAQQPPEVLEALDAIAPTLAYDLALSRAGGVPAEVLAAVRVPATVLSSDTGSGPLGGWAEALAFALPGGRHRTLPGGWHEVPEDLLAEAITEAIAGAASVPAEDGPLVRCG